MKVLETFLRAGEGEERRKLERTADKVLALEPKMSKLTDDELKAKTDEFKQRLINGAKLDELTVEAFAVAREAARRILGLHAYKVQLMAGLALHQGKIAEQKTGEGKAVDINTLIPTPQGWKKAGVVEIGDMFFDRHGKPTEVIGVYPQGFHDVYEVVLRDGRTIRCNADHLWSVYKGYTKSELHTLSTLEMFEQGARAKRGYNYHLPMAEAVEYEKKHLSLSPYAMGSLLGNGCKNTTGSFMISSNDAENVEAVATELGTTAVKTPSRKYTWVFKKNVSEKHRLKIDDIAPEYKALLSDFYCHEKYIPEEYKLSSISQRWALLQGLMDTDGNIHEDEDKKRYNLQYSTTSPRLRDDILEVIYSLGLSATWKLGKTVERNGVKHDQYVVRINVPHDVKPSFFRISRKKEVAITAAESEPRKKDYSRIAIAEIRKLDEQVEQVCFTVDNEEHLFLVGNYVVTHNTLTSAFPSYLNALTEEGVHIVTVNDYLAKYQGQQMGRVFTALGLTTGIMQNGQSIEERREQYEADITYGTNNEFGFDYLKDNMVDSLDEKVQRGHAFAIVDEVDSILIDEARTPLIISGPAEREVDKWFRIFARIAQKLEIDEHYEVDLKKRTVSILPEGIERVEDSLGIKNLYVKKNTPLIGYLNNAVRAKELFKLDKDYVVRDGEIQIVDEHTGRVLSGRRYNDGIHQAIEAKEKVEVKPENQTYATITVQNYFKQYTKLSGMTGTAETEAAEFSGTYKLGVLPVPTNKPVRRIDQPDKIYRTEEAKFKAVLDEVAKRHATGQPILIGTASVSHSERLSRMLHEIGVEHNVLNAKQHEKEASVVALAGTKNAVTVATNMAGRGTDIILGGNVDFITTRILEDRGLTPTDTPDEYEAEWTKVFEEVSEQVAKEAEEVRELGGLYVIGTERHESRRIDNQLRGRSGRQGDPGESVFFLSLQDELVRRFNSGNALDAIVSRVIDDDVPISGRFVSGSIQTAQKQIETLNYETRKNILKYDEVLTKQRELLYSDRDKVLAGYDLTKTIMIYMESVISNIIEKTITSKKTTEEELDKVFKLLSKIYPVSLSKEGLLKTYGTVEKLDKRSLKREFLEDADAAYERREQEIGVENMNELVSRVMIDVMDKRWREHLYEMDYLKEGIGLRAMAQKDPLVEYNEEGYRMFKNLREIVKEDVIIYLFNAEVSVKDVEKLSKMVPAEVQKLLASAPKNPKIMKQIEEEQEAQRQKKEAEKMSKKNTNDKKNNEDLLNDLKKAYGNSEKKADASDGKDISALGMNRAERRKLKKNSNKAK